MIFKDVFMVQKRPTTTTKPPDINATFRNVAMFFFNLIKYEQGNNMVVNVHSGAGGSRDTDDTHNIQKT